MPAVVHHSNSVQGLQIQEAQNEGLAEHAWEKREQGLDILIPNMIHIYLGQQG